ncbi:pyocin, partial [Salmonella enterica]|nr:pyocin [Salmonella enterica]
MGRRVITHGRGQALDGDKTTTGAKCISSLPNVKNCGKGVVRLGDRTTVCPKCSKPGTIITGELSVSYGGSPAAVDGSFVMCGCPMGTNRVIAPIGQVSISEELSQSHANNDFLPQQPPPPMPVFAKSCLRGMGCTDAGTSPEPSQNFMPVGYFMATPFSGDDQYNTQHIADNTSLNNSLAESEQHVETAATFPVGAVVFSWISGQFSTVGTWGAKSAASNIGEILVGGAGAPVAAFLVAMMPGKLNSGEQDFIDKMRLSQIADIEGTAPTRVRFAWEEQADGHMMPTGYHTDANGGWDQVPVRNMVLNSQTGNYEFTTEGIKPITIYWNPAKLDFEFKNNTGNQEPLNLPPTITVTPIPEETGGYIETYPADEKNFSDYILILPIPDIPPIYIYFSKPDVNFLEVDLYENFKGRSRQQKYQVDHIPSAAAVKA